MKFLGIEVRRTPATSGVQLPLNQEQSDAPTGLTFEMRGCRELLSDYPAAGHFKAQVEIIERAALSNSGLVFTHCRGLLESICRTVLSDRGVTVEADASPNSVMSRTLKVLQLTDDIFKADIRVEEGVVDLTRGINQFVNGLVALRNSQGIGPHGKDALDVFLSPDYGVLCATSTDLVCRLLYKMHKKQLEVDPSARMGFGDHADFDEWFDLKHADFNIEEVPLSASRALYDQEREEYRSRLVVFLNSGGAAGLDEDIAEGETIGEEL